MAPAGPGQGLGVLNLEGQGTKVGHSSGLFAVSEWKLFKAYSPRETLFFFLLSLCPNSSTGG